MKGENIPPSPSVYKIIALQVNVRYRFKHETLFSSDQNLNIDFLPISQPNFFKSCFFSTNSMVMLTQNI
jgi:hypothetical protein